MEKSKLIVLVGLPGSGKSVKAKELQQKENAVTHSSDSLREELFGDVNECDRNDELFKELHKRVKQDLTDGKTVIYDATNISYKKRKAFLEVMRKTNCYKVCYLIATPYEQCLVQNNQRERIVPEYVIKKMYKNIHIPQYYEGWDEIHIEWNYDSSKFKPAELYFKLQIPHDNPHHSLDIYGHCSKTFNSIITDNKYLKVAALFHDIGKPFCKEFRNSKGEETEIAHYYQHHVVSAYDSLFYLKSILNYEDHEILKTTNYIQWHMQPYFIETEKAKRKFINLVGQEFYNNLLVLNQADREAH